MKKLIPALVAVVLIAVVAIVSLKTGLLDKYSYSMERADVRSYFNVSAEDDVAIIFENAISESKGKLLDGIYYLPFDLVIAEFNPRFYHDEHAGTIMYTTPTQIITAPVDGTACTIADAAGNAATEETDYIIARTVKDRLYLAVDYVKKYTNLTCRIYGEPNRMVLQNAWGSKQTARISEATNLRELGGVKSAILTELAANDSVTVLEKMDNWCEVATTDGYIGYVENKFLKDEGEELEIAIEEYEEPVYTNISKDYTINLVWHQVMSEAANDTFDSMISRTKGVTTVSPTWFSLQNNEGDVADIGSAAYVQKAHAMGMEVWALVDNFTYPEADTKEILSYTDKRMKVIQFLMDAADRYNLDGINIDFENLAGDAGVHFVQFIRELSIFCRNKGLVLSVDNYVPEAYSGHYDRKEQGQVVDYVIVMGYDEHYGSSKESGSVASLPFVKRGIENTLAEVPAEKVINAVPFYTRIWTETPKTEEELAAEDESEEYYPNKVTSEAVGMEGAETFLRNKNVIPVWDEEASQNYGELTENGVTYKVWLEDEDSLMAKLNVMKENNLAGVASWKLGMEKPSAWEVIGAYLKGN